MEENVEYTTPESHDAVPEIKWYQPVMEETTFSKYFAFALFIVLPCLGFWLGYEYNHSRIIADTQIFSTTEIYPVSSDKSTYQVIKHYPSTYPEYIIWDEESPRFRYNESLKITKADGTEMTFGLHELASPVLLNPPVNWPSGVDDLYLLISEYSDPNLVTGLIKRRLGQGDPPMYVGENEFTIDLITGAVEIGNVTLNVDPESGVALESYKNEWKKEQEAIWDPIIANMEIEKKADLIKVNSLQPLDEISSPLSLSGEARGYWFFEANAPVVLTDWDGKIIAEGYVTVEDDWMTEDFVTFSGEIEFKSPYQAGDPDFMQKGTLIFKKANASGLPEHDDALEIPIIFYE